MSYVYERGSWVTAAKLYRNRVTTVEQTHCVKTTTQRRQPYAAKYLLRTVTDNTDYGEATIDLTSKPHLENIIIQTVFDFWASLAQSARNAQMFPVIAIDMDRIAIELLEQQTGLQESSEAYTSMASRSAHERYRDGLMVRIIVDELLDKLLQST
jgi:hypothetical protein